MKSHATGSVATGGAVPHCVLLSTGGTIASRIDPSTGLAMPVSSAKDLLTTLPDLQNRLTVDMEDIARIPSPHIGPAEWQKLHARIVSLFANPDVSGVVVSHGTGLLEETAWFLDVTIPNGKPVVIVGAQRNSSEPDSDGPRNLLNALQVCASPEACDLGVLVVQNQHIHAARDVHKIHTFDVEAFSSGEWGYLGHVVDGRVYFNRHPAHRLHIPYSGQALPRVDVIPMYAGASGSLLKAAVADGAKGLVVQAVGSGHVNPSFASAIGELIQQGVPVVVTTRVQRGGTRVCYGFEGASRRLLDDGAVLAGELSAWKARIVLMLAMGSADFSPQRLRRLLGT